MITFKKFLNETEYTQFDLQSIADIIKRDCRKWLKEVKNPKEFPVYRGARQDVSFNMLHKKTVRTDRRPKDTPRKMHNHIDDWFNKQFNIKFRSQSVFVTGNLSNARLFGPTFVIFPIGDFDYCWSTDFDDMTEDIDNAIEFRVKKLLKSGDISDTEFNWFKTRGYSDILSIDAGNEILDYVLNEAGYKMNSDLLKAIRMGNEIMIHCDEYYMLGPRDVKRMDAVDNILDLL